MFIGLFALVSASVVWMELTSKELKNRQSFNVKDYFDHKWSDLQTKLETETLNRLLVRLKSIPYPFSTADYHSIIYDVWACYQEATNPDITQMLTDSSKERTWKGIGLKLSANCHSQEDRWAGACSQVRSSDCLWFAQYIIQDILSALNTYYV